ncbi:MAG: right-handed parallel beta-helix repeat-containing protein [Elusimicrobia bacterium]|nr:right-handed parallel beta-helix repeat-containing protein [Elusimicrobiota bacterium]
MDIVVEADHRVCRTNAPSPVSPYKAVGKVIRSDERKAPARPNLDGAATIRALAAYNGKLYAGDYGKIYVSADGNDWSATNSGAAVGSSIRALAAYNGKFYAGDYGNGKVYQITPVTAALSGFDGSTSAQTLTATGLNLVQSTNSLTCGGVSPCGATNQVKFTVSDLAGNVKVAGPYAILVSVPPSSLTSLSASQGPYTGSIQLAWTWPQALQAGSPYYIQYSTNSRETWSWQYAQITKSTGTVSGGQWASAIVGGLDVGRDGANADISPTYHFRVWVATSASGVPSGTSNAASSKGKLPGLFTVNFTNFGGAGTPGGGWLSTLNGPSNGNDGAFAAAVDKSSNVYATYYCTDGTKGLYVLKYDRLGAIQWTKYYNSPVNTDVGAEGIGVDGAGNVFVAGQELRTDLSQGENILVRKYDTDGNLLWHSTYNSPGNNTDMAMGLAVDGAGNAYAAGWVTRGDLGQGHNMWLRKYGPSGLLQWTTTYNSPANSDDEANGVAVDGSGNVYLVGSENRTDLGQGVNMRILKYDPNALLQWTTAYTSPGSQADVARGVALDSAGDLFVTGYETISGQSQNVWLRKYDSSGQTLWTKTYDSPAHAQDVGYGVAVDTAGNPYVAGTEQRTDLGTSWDIWVRKYDSDGLTQWTTVYTSPGGNMDTAYGIGLTGSMASISHAFAQADGASFHALNFVGASFNTVEQCAFANANGIAAYLGFGSNGNTILRSTITSSWQYALYIIDSSSNLVTQSALFNPAGYAAAIDISFPPAYSIHNTISQSTITSASAGFPALLIGGAAFNTADRVYAQGSTAVQISGSTGTAIRSSTLVGTGSGGSGVRVSSGSVGLDLSTNTVIGGAQGAGVRLDSGNAGLLSLSSNTVKGSRYGLNIATQAAGASLSIAFMTFESLPAGATAIHFLGGTFVSTFSDVNFLDQDIAVNVNGSLLAAGSRITMRNAAGPRGGPIYENDPNSQVDWPDFSSAIYPEGFMDIFTSSLSVLWSASFPSGTRYYVQLSTASDFTGAVLSSATYDFAATFTGLSPNVPYYARASYSPSGPFTSLGTTMPALLPGPPGAPSGMALGISSIAWTWSAASDAVGYRVLHAGSASLLGTSSIPGFMQTSLATNTAYGIVAGATNPSGQGPLSTATTVYTLAAPPSGTSASSVEGTSATISWSLNTNPAWTLAEAQRSIDGAAFVSVFSGSATAYTDYYLLGCTTYFYRVRNRNRDGIATAFDATVQFLTKASTPLASGGLSAESAAGRRIQLAWEKSPSEGITGYRLYYDLGTGTIDYAVPLAVFNSTVSSYLTEPLSSGYSYKFGLRAVNRCGVEERNVRLLAVATVLESLTGVQAAIKVPQGGKKIMGNRVTVLAELIRGDSGQTRNIRFQYKGVAEAGWHDIVVPVRTSTTPILRRTSRTWCTGT